MRPLVLGFASLASCVALVVAPAVAGAQPSQWANNNGAPPSTGPTIVYSHAPQPPTSAWDRVGQRGIEFQIRGGLMLPDSKSPVLAPNLYPSLPGDAVGAILEGKEGPYGPDPFGLSVVAGYRFLEFLSAGVFFTYASFNSLDGTDSGDYVDTTSQLQRQAWQLGAYLRYYLTGLHPRLQPWVELGVGYAQDTASYVRGAVQGGMGNVTQDYYLSYSGLAVPLTIGLDWRLAPVFSVGPTLGYTRVFALHGCVDSEPQGDAQNPVPAYLPPKNTCASPPVQTNGYGMIFGGIFAKVTFDPFTR